MAGSRSRRSRQQHFVPPTKLCAYPDCRKPIPGMYGVPGVSTSRLDGKTMICSACGVREALNPQVMATLDYVGKGGK